MNTFWLKLAVVLVVVAGGFGLVKKYSTSTGQTEPAAKTFSDVIKEDDVRLRADIEPADKVEKAEGLSVKAAEEITPEDKMQAERLFEMALMERKMARLPGMSYKKMVDYCREIIEKYPQSSEALKAKRMLGDIPEADRRRYKITDKEIGLVD